jgi:hypothetical protein
MENQSPNGQSVQAEQDITQLLKDSIILESEKRKINRPSWKTEYKTSEKLINKLKIQRNSAIAFAAGLLLYIVIKILASGV